MSNEFIEKVVELQLKNIEELMPYIKKEEKPSVKMAMTATIAPCTKETLQAAASFFVIKNKDLSVEIQKLLEHMAHLKGNFKLLKYLETVH